MDIREEFREGRPLLFDGGMGTYFAEKFPGERCEAANLTRPEEIAAIHRAYLEAGCRAIKTNTFAVSGDLAQGQEAEEIIEAACRLAVKEAEPYNAYVFADIGPAPAGKDRAEIYRRQADLFLAQGIRHFLIETLSSDEGVPQLARYLKDRCPDAFLIVSFAVAFDGITQEGYAGKELFQRAAAMEEVDAAGFNCVSGPRHLLEYIRTLDTDGGCLPEGTLLSVMPNAGYPTALERRTMFQGRPDYFGRVLAEIAQAGASIVGGCCGTTPAHIRQAAQALDGGRLPDAGSPGGRGRLPDAGSPGGRSRLLAESAGDRLSDRSRLPSPAVSITEPARPAPQANTLAEKLDRGERIVAIELDPPVDDDIGFYLEGVRKLRAAGADAVTLADNPIGRPRADSCLLACKIKRELGIEPLPHMTCRDRNLNATKALLLGLSIEGVHNVLLVTGDPIPTADRDEVKSVFNFNSRKLIRYVSGLGESVLRTPFHIFAALNLNARYFDRELERAKEKEEAGACGFLTQPVLSERALENLKLARQELRGKILGGVFPVVSYKNACFLKNEISGMDVCDEIAALYEGKDKEAAEDIAVKVSAQIAREIVPYTDGLYLMTPFKRVALMTRILDRLRETGEI